ncbi:MAG: ATP-dependent DNA helicase UvrD2 [Galactobacter sp.]
MTPEEILTGLDPEQAAVAAQLHGPMVVIAGAGTGKTRAITHRIAHGVAAGEYVPQQVLAVTFTARAAAEMRTRLRGLGAAGVQAHTFHAAALRQLQYFWPQAVGGFLPHLLDHKAPLVAEAARRLRLPADRATVRDLAGEIEWAKVSMLTPETYAAPGLDRDGVGELDHQAMARLYQAYEDVKTDRGMIDFEDVLLLMVGIIEDDERIAAEIRSQYRHFTVDEYQDVSPLQQRLLDGWVGGRGEVCVVGDPSQTIYSFTGATPRHLLEFTCTHPGAAEVHLVRDYRSTPEVVNLANRVLTSRRPERRLDQRGTVWAQPLELIAQREHGPAAEFHEAADDEQEAQFVASRIKALTERDGVKLRDIAVLYRTNGQSEAIERALSDAGIGYQLRGAERFFQRREVKEALAQIRTSARQVPGELAVDLVPTLLSSLGWQRSAPTGTGAVREKWESLSALVALAKDMDGALAEENLSMAAFAAELEARAATAHAPVVEGVTLASLHSSKGLEWDTVFLAGLSEGLMPISFAEDQAGVDEERRLLYVGITRAKSRLIFSWSLSRTTGGRGRRRRSRFLDGIAPSAQREAGRPEAGPRSRRKSAAPARCRICGRLLDTAAEVKLKRCSDCPAGYDEAVYEALRDWRTRAAKDSGMPAFVVFTDATLMALAEAMPRTEREFLAIPGVGRSKLQRYGEDVLSVLADLR